LKTAQASIKGKPASSKEVAHAYHYFTNVSRL